MAADILVAIYKCLGGISIRSALYAIADLYVNTTLREVDLDKALDIIAQNLAGYFGVTPTAAREIIKNAIICAKEENKLPENAFTTAVGNEKTPTLAHLVNRYVPKEASPRAKLEIIKKLNLQKDGIKISKDEVSARGEGLASLKAAISAVREYYPNAPFADIDLMRTAAAISRKIYRQKPLSSRDIFVREYSQIADKPIYVALDVSGSMKEYMQGATKLRVAKNLLARYFRKMAMLRGRTALVLFNVEADYMWIPYNAQQYLREMIEILKYIYASGGTELASALELLHGDGASSDIVLITDGRTSDPDRVMALARKFRRIHAVATERSQFLKLLTKTTGGKYVELSPNVDIL